MSRKMNRMEIRDEKIARIAAQPHWNGVLKVDDLTERVLNKEITVAELTKLDALFQGIAAEAFDEQPGNDVLQGILMGWAEHHMRMARKALWVLFEGHPLLRELDIAIVALTGAKTRKPYPQRARQFSVFPEQLPQPMQDALRDMADGLPGAHDTVPVPSMVMTTRTKVCELAKAALDADLEVQITVETASAYERSLFRREKPLSKKTILSAVRQVRDFARYIGADEAVLEHFAERIRFNESRSLHAEPQKEAKVLALPDYSGIFGMALDMLGEAAVTRNGRSSQRLRNGAVAITLFCPFPFRVADTFLHFGRVILWDGEGYRFNLIIQKTRRPFSAPVLPVFGWFIDQMILQGAAPEHLHDLRAKCFADQRALFVNHYDGEPHDRFVSYMWQQILGTGNHAARTHLHDSFGRMGARGVELAMRACGQRSEKTAEAYRTRAFELLSLERIHEDLAADILDEEWEVFFGQPDPE